MKPYIHCKNSVKQFGGSISDYEKIHNWIDSSKAHFCDSRHRVLLHNSFGIYLCEQVFGHTITNSDGKIISVRDVAEVHILEDIGFIPTVQDYLQEMPFLDWFSRLSAEETEADVKTNMRPKKEKIIKDPPAKTEEQLKEEFKKITEEIEKDQKKLPHTPQGLDPADMIVDGAGNPFYRRNRGRALD